MVVSLSVEVAHAAEPCGARPSVPNVIPRSPSVLARVPGPHPGCGVCAAREGAEQPVCRPGRNPVELGPEPGEPSTGGGELRVAGAVGRVGDRELDHRGDRPGGLVALEDDLVQGAFRDPGLDGPFVVLPVAGESGGDNPEIGEDVADGPEDHFGEVGRRVHPGEGDAVGGDGGHRSVTAFRRASRSMSGF